MHASPQSAGSRLCPRRLFELMSSKTMAICSIKRSLFGKDNADLFTLLNAQVAAVRNHFGLPTRPSRRRHSKSWKAIAVSTKTQIDTEASKSGPLFSRADFC